MVIDPSFDSWTDQSFAAPALRDLVIYELHVGTFTAEGTFAAAMTKLDHVARLGATAIEIMPIGDFPGNRNWGYDGVAIYAPSRAYGHPDDLRRLVNAAHELGLAVILDVVYNHLGPDGNYVGAFHSGYYSSVHKTPWGSGYNYEAEPVRNFFVENPTYWMEEFHIDGFRLDATHAIKDSSTPHLLAEIAESVQEHNGFVIVEDDRNEPKLLRPRSADGFGLDGCWADDFHHVVRVALTSDREGYYANYSGSTAELLDTIEHGWHYRGQRQLASGKARGGETEGLSPEQFIYCISNHDQTGNRALGERLNQVVSAAQYRAATALLCFAPSTPLLFMGQEWSTASPFQFFTDHEKELGRKITEGRRKEFRHFAAFADEDARDRIPDPQLPQTFLASKLRWQELEEVEHRQVLLLYREALRLRRSHPLLRQRGRANWKVQELEGGVLAIVYGLQSDRRCVVLTNLRGSNDFSFDKHLDLPAGQKWHCLLSTNEARFGGADERPFLRPGTLLLESVASSCEEHRDANRVRSRASISSRQKGSRHTLDTSNLPNRN